MLEGGLVHIVLVHANADGLGIDLDQFGQRVLGAPGDGNRPADGYIHVREFLASQGRGRIDRGAGFIHDQVFGGFGMAAGQLSHQFLGLARGGAIANRDQGDLVTVKHVFERGQRADPVVLWFVRVDGAGIQQFTGRIHYGQLGAGTETGIEPQRSLAGQRRLGKQGAQIGGENVNGMAIRFFAQFTAHIPFDGWKQQAVGGILDGQAELI